MMFNKNLGITDIYEVYHQAAMQATAVKTVSLFKLS